MSDGGEWTGPIGPTRYRTTGIEACMINGASVSTTAHHPILACSRERWSQREVTEAIGPEEHTLPIRMLQPKGGTRIARM